MTALLNWLNQPIRPAWCNFEYVPTRMEMLEHGVVAVLIVGFLVAVVMLAGYKPEDEKR